MVSSAPTKGSAAFLAFCWMLVATMVATLNTMTGFGTNTTITILRAVPSLPCWILAVASFLLPTMMCCIKWCVECIVRLPFHTTNKMDTFIKSTITFFTNWQKLANSDNLSFSDVCVQWCLFVTLVPFITIAWALFGMAHLLEPVIAPTFKGFNHVLVITNTLLNFALIVLLDPFGAAEALLRQTVVVCAGATSHDKLKNIPLLWRLLVILTAVSFGFWAEVTLALLTPYLATLNTKWDLCAYTHEPRQPIMRATSCPPMSLPVASPPGAPTSSSTSPSSRAASPCPSDFAPLDTRANLLGPDADVDAVATITVLTNGHRDKHNTTAHTTEAFEAPAATNTTEESAVGVSLSRASSTSELSRCPSVVPAEPSSSSLAAEASSSSVASSSSGGSVVGSNINTGSSVARSSHSNSTISESDAGSSVASSSVARSGCVSSVEPELPRIPPVRCVAGGVHFMREFRLFAEVGALGSRMVAGGVELGSIASFVGKGSESLLSRFVASLPRAPKGAVWGDSLEYRVVFSVAAGCTPQWEVICIHHWAGATPECDPQVSTPQDFLRVCWAAEHFTALLAG